MNNLTTRARELLENKTVQVIIGYARPDSPYREIGFYFTFGKTLDRNGPVLLVKSLYGPADKQST